MVDIKAFPYLCFVRFDLVNKEFDRQFNIHFDDHIQELADKPGYSTGPRANCAMATTKAFCGRR